MILIHSFTEYGACGVGAYCLGGCDPRMSFSLDSCAPAPVCKDMNMKMDSIDSIVDVSKYLGDGDKADWVVQGEAVEAGGNVLLTMPKGSVGTVMASSHYMWYGSVKARMKTSRGRGVVTAFILLSDVKDEIDYEWVGVDLKTSQTNYYFQGIPLCKYFPSLSSGFMLIVCRRPIEEHHSIGYLQQLARVRDSVDPRQDYLARQWTGWPCQGAQGYLERDHPRLGLPPDSGACATVHLARRPREQRQGHNRLGRWCD